ncbi:MAG: protein translocase subunit SecD [Xanthomonadaceae bacterium]|nr:protein translocase subunit SecD [Xanthomonadaceae bacterium]
MINEFPAWKNWLVLIVVAVGLLYAAPNLFPEDPAVQVSRANVATMDRASVAVVEDALRNTGTTYRESELRDGLLYILFDETEAQLQGLDALRAELGRGWVVALNRVSRTPGWLRALGGAPMNLGLDLVGGVHFLLEVDLVAAVTQAEERYENSVRGLLRNQNIRYGLVTREPGRGIQVTFRAAEDRDRAVRAIGGEFEQLTVRPFDDAEPTLLVTLSETEQEAVRAFAVEQNITTLRNRVNELGVAEPLVQRQGQHRIVVQLPGVQDTARAKEILGATATLEWRLVYQDGDPYDAQASGRVPLAARLYTDNQGQPVLLRRDVIATGDQLTGASSGIDSETGSPAVFINLDATAARRMTQTTRENLNRPMAVVIIENRTDIVERNGEMVRVRETVEEVISIATIRGVFGARFQITGLEPQEARNLALLLRAGALAAPMDIVEERTVGPSMGADNIRQGFLAVLIGFAVVVVFIALYYRMFGLVANTALLTNLVLIIAVMSMIPGATLTMPGIAGIVLTVGMAIDANVLIFERIREEIRLGNTPQAAIHSGYDKAFSSIADANVTTLIAAVVLFLFGTGPIKGFAVTLSIGIITSMFTAIVGTRAIVNAVWGGRKLRELPI